MNISAVKCPTVPLSGEASLIASGFAFAVAIISASVENAAVGEATAGAYESGPLAKLGAGPEAVAKTIERAINARRPRARYRVTASAKLLLTQRRMMPDRAWDAFLRSQFPQPK